MQKNQIKLAHLALNLGAKAAFEKAVRMKMNQRTVLVHQKGTIAKAV